MSSFFRKNIESMTGYTPGEQPKPGSIIKLNTNENPFPPSPKITELLNQIDLEKLRFYPNPTADSLRDEIADTFGLTRENIIVGNGSDDILTMTARSFIGEGDSAACFEPSYSLYPVLTELQSSQIIKIPLIGNCFDFPEEILDINSKLFKKIKNCKLFFIARPNAPTGNSFPIEQIMRFSKIFSGVVFIDEAYADFAEDNAIHLLGKYPNILISRTLSKSYSLAGLRLGWAMASPEIISGMMKVKDSYNVGYIQQLIATDAIRDQKYFLSNKNKVIKIRKQLTQSLKGIGFSVIDSQANFIFTSPPNEKGEELYDFLRSKKIIVRYFPGTVTGKYIRISIGQIHDMDKLFQQCKEFLKVL